MVLTQGNGWLGKHVLRHGGPSLQAMPMCQLGVSNVFCVDWYNTVQISLAIKWSKLYGTNTLIVNMTKCTK